MQLVIHRLQVVIGDLFQAGQAGIHPFRADGHLIGNVVEAHRIAGLVDDDGAYRLDKAGEVRLVARGCVLKTGYFLRRIAQIVKALRVNQPLQSESPQQLESLPGQRAHSRHPEALGVNFHLAGLLHALADQLVVKMLAHRLLHRVQMGGVATGVNDALEGNELPLAVPIACILLPPRGGALAHSDRSGFFEGDAIGHLLFQKGDLAGQGVHPQGSHLTHEDLFLVAPRIAAQESFHCAKGHPAKFQLLVTEMAGQNGLTVDDDAEKIHATLLPEAEITDELQGKVHDNHPLLAALSHLHLFGLAVAEYRVQLAQGDQVEGDRLGSRFQHQANLAEERRGKRDLLLLCGDLPRELLRVVNFHASRPLRKIKHKGG